MSHMNIYQIRPQYPHFSSHFLLLASLHDTRDYLSQCLLFKMMLAGQKLRAMYYKNFLTSVISNASPFEGHAITTPGARHYGYDTMRALKRSRISPLRH